MQSHSVDDIAVEERTGLLGNSNEMNSITPLDDGGRHRERVSQNSVDPSQVHYGHGDNHSNDMVFSRNPHAAILSQLPSHQARSSENGPTLARSSSQRHWGRQTSTIDLPRRRATVNIRRRHTSRVPSATLVSMLREPREPGDVDSDSDNDTVDGENFDEMDNDELWHRRKTVKYMPTNLTVKRKYRQQVITQQSRTGTGLYTLKRKSFYKLRLQLNEVRGQLEVWAKSLKVIEGHFGSAILSYFTFVRWLMFLNLFIGLLLFCVITIPYLVLQPGKTFGQYSTAINITDPLIEQAIDCSSNYSLSVQGFVKEHVASDYILDFLQGTGFMERTVLFYGIYFNKTLPGFMADGIFSGAFTSVYNMPLAYIMATGTYFIVSFLLIIRHSAAGLKEGLLSQENSLTKYCNKVFSGWDYCITDQSKAKLKNRNLRKELEADLFEQQMEKERAARSTGDWVKLYLIRIFINAGVLCILGGALALIYLTNNWSLELQQNKQITNQFVVLLVQFLPSITITILNVIVPVIFDLMVMPEGYSPGFEIKITLVRTVLLRLASIAILMISLYDQVVATTQIGDAARQLNQEICDASSASENTTSSSTGALCATNSNTTEIRRCGNKDFGKIKCWETYVGQQLYKLVLLDLIVVILTTFLVEFPRKLLYRKFHDKSKLINWLGAQQFDIPRNVLDIVYCQTLCWLGAFFSPLIPFISMLKCFIFFYIKKLTLLHNCDPPEKPFRTSRSNSFFMTVLLLSFIMASFPIGYMIGRIPPSQSCGPFRVYSQEVFFMFDTISNIINTFSSTARDFFYYFGSVAFYVPAIILLCLLMYYFWVVAQGYKKMSELLKHQLAMEGKDKQYLLLRVTEALKRG